MYVRAGAISAKGNTGDAVHVALGAIRQADHVLGGDFAELSFAKVLCHTRLHWLAHDEARTELCDVLADISSHFKQVRSAQR
jgi:hypothetical protein